MSLDLDFLVDLLDLEPIEVNIFRGVSPDEDRQRVFGGQVAAQSLTAAGRTVDSGRPHSLHAYFLRPGDPTIPGGWNTIEVTCRGATLAFRVNGQDMVTLTDLSRASGKIVFTT